MKAINLKLCYQGRSGFPGIKGDGGTKGQKGENGAGVSLKAALESVPMFTYYFLFQTKGERGNDGIPGPPGLPGSSLGGYGSAMGTVTFQNTETMLRVRSMKFI